MVIKILGTGCPKCLSLERKVRNLAQKHDLDIDIQKITDINEIMKYGVMMTPGLVINEKVKITGKIPGDQLILDWLKEADNE